MERAAGMEHCAWDPPPAGASPMVSVPPEHCGVDPSDPRMENATLPVGTPLPCVPWVTVAVIVIGWPGTAGDVAVMVVTVALPLPPAIAGAAVTAVATNARVAPMLASRERDGPPLFLCFPPLPLCFLGVAMSPLSPVLSCSFTHRLPVVGSSMVVRPIRLFAALVREILGVDAGSHAASTPS